MEARESPTITPSRLARSKAVVLPRNTMSGRPEELPRAMVANWVLSPNSARKMVRNVEETRATSMERSAAGSGEHSVDPWSGSRNPVQFEAEAGAEEEAQNNH